MARDTRFPKVSQRPLARLRVAGLPSRCTLPTMQLRSLRPWRTPRDSPPCHRLGEGSAPPPTPRVRVRQLWPQLSPREGAGRCWAARSLLARAASVRSSCIRSHCAYWMLGLRHPGSPRCPTAWERNTKVQRPTACDPHRSAASSSARRAHGQGGMMV